MGSKLNKLENVSFNNFRLEELHVRNLETYIFRKGLKKCCLQDNQPRLNFRSYVHQPYNHAPQL